MLIFYFVYTKRQVLLICNENKEISVANLMIQFRGLFPLGYRYLGVFVLNGIKECNARELLLQAWFTFFFTNMSLFC